MDSASSDYIVARFDMLVENIDTNSQHELNDAFSKQVQNDDKTKDTRSKSVIAREKMMKDSQDAWKGSQDAWKGGAK